MLLPKSALLDLVLVVIIKLFLFLDIPVITLQPTDKQESINGIAVFLVEAQCVHNLHYQWYHNGRPLPGKRNASFSMLILEIDKTDVNSNL